MRILFYFLMSAAFVMPNDLYAQNKSQRINADSSYDKVVMPEIFSSSVLIDDDEKQPIEPNVAKVKFLGMPDVRGKQERVDRLIQGIKKDLPPEYDHYGYEIRRYMARVGNLKIFEDEEYLKQQIKNVKKAKIIANFWKELLENEVKAIGDIVENDESVTFAVRTAFKQNKLTTRTFMISLHSWIDANETFLLHIFNSPPNTYEILYPEVIIKEANLRLDFYNKLNARQIKLKEIRSYQLFAMMVY